MSRLIIVSNRVAAVPEGKSSAGGLAVGVHDALKHTGGIWFGWNGEIVNEPPEAATLHQQGAITYATVGLARQDYDQYYRGFSNATLWPIFHYRTDLSRYDRKEYAGYLRVNDTLARQLQPLVQPADLIWVHDYHLLPFARACRRLGMRNRIGFFLHIPFPCEQVLMTVPPHRELVQAMCEYDLLGFQTDLDEWAFVDYACHRLGARRIGAHELDVAGRRVRTGVYPIGIYPDEIRQQFVRRPTPRHILNLKQGLHDRKLIMSVDRLDYTKGLVERFRAFGRMLELAPQHQRQVTFVQIAPPSRSDIATYQGIRQQLEREAGHINGRWSDLEWTPLRYIAKHYERSTLMALYGASHVGYVTPLRDGMNLVAKEYVAAQPPEDPGVLVLSCFAGAARELEDGALIVNPYDIEELAQALDRALAMPLKERQQRHARMMERLRANDLGRWRDRFLADLRRTARAGAGLYLAAG
jgi:alpha,alpha-trehalose-phosphate synthase [UDP-forming]